jgi:hypothetical protein
MTFINLSSVKNSCHLSLVAIGVPDAASTFLYASPLGQPEGIGGAGRVYLGVMVQAPRKSIKRIIDNALRIIV